MDQRESFSHRMSRYVQHSTTDGWLRTLALASFVICMGILQVAPNYFAWAVTSLLVLNFIVSIVRVNQIADKDESDGDSR